MKANSLRNIKNGKEYDKYFNHAKMGIINLPKGDVFYTLDKIQELVLNTLNQTNKISKVLDSSSLKATTRNVWNFLYNHIQYKEDDAGIEQLRTPSRSWADRFSGIDCDCFSVFISSILTNLNINHSLRIAEYGAKGYYQHVYIIVPIDGKNINKRSSYIVIDPVVDNYNYEETFTKKHDKKMNISHQVLNGIETNSPEFGYEFDVLEGLGNTNSNLELKALKSHLSNTLVELNKNPKLVENIISPSVFKEQLEYVLENWDEPIARMAALEEMEEMEVLNEDAPVKEVFFGDSNPVTKVKMLRSRRKKQQRVVPAMLTINSMPSSILKHSKQSLGDGLGRKRKKRHGLGNFFNKVKDAVSNAANKVGNGFKAAAQKVKKYNPIFLALRGGVLLALKMNLFKVTEHLKYGYLTEQEAIARGINLNEYRKVVHALSVALKWWKSIEGDEARFKQAIQNGRHGGLGVVAEGSAAAGVAALLAKIGKFLKKINWKKIIDVASKFGGKFNNPFKRGGEANDRSSNLPDFPPTPPPVAPPPVAPPKLSNATTNYLYAAGGVGLLALTFYYIKNSNSNTAKPISGTPYRKLKEAII